MTIKIYQNMLQGVLFDLDNTLVSCTMDFDRMRNAVGCPEGTDILEYVSGLDRETQHKAHQVITDIEVEDAHHSVPFDGLSELFSTFQSHNIPTAIVTRNCHQAARIKLGRAKLTTDILLTREDFPAKPDPTALIHIANTWQKKPSQLLFVGDYKYDLLAAKNANMPSCLVHNDETSPFISLASYTSRDLVTLKQDLKPFIQPNTLDL